jgi:hypothetical protein
MTKTSLSAATCARPKAQRVYSAPQRRLGEAPNLVRDARGFQWHRHSCLCAVAKPITQQIAEATLSLPSKILIANPRLTLRVSPIRTCKLKISNRKFSAISHRTLPGSDLLSPVTRRSPLATALLIETPRLEIAISPILSTSSNFLIETKTAFSLNPTAKTRIQCGREGESA